MRLHRRLGLPALAALSVVAGCDRPGGDPARQYGPDPYLPEPHQFLLPPMSVPKEVGWRGTDRAGRA